MFHPLFGLSLQKGAKFIAICDVVICCFYILSHFIGGGYVYEEKHEKFEHDLHTLRTSNENQTLNRTEINSTAANVRPTLAYNLTSEDIYKLLAENLPSPDIIIIIGVFVVIFAIAHVCMEIWMCRLLLKAAAHKDGSACKTWFWCRLGITILFSLYSTVGLIEIQTDILDWICELLNIYRIYTLVIIYAFAKEIAASVSIVKPR